jgi:hypothetical protein
MAERRTPEDATSLDVLIDGFEKNENLDGFHWRHLPMPDEDSALRKFSSLSDEAQRWKGQPIRAHEQPDRRLVAWPDLEIRVAGRGLIVRARTPRFNDWWHDERTWDGDPMGPIFDWIAEDRDS